MGLNPALAATSAACILVLSGLFPHPSPAAAQQRGIAFATAPEQALTHCYGDNADTAMKCARRKCRETGAAECLRTRWCYPAGWSGIMSINLSSGFHFPTELCGMPSRKALLGALEVMCLNWDEADACHIGQVFSPKGAEETMNIDIDPNKP